MSESIQLKEPLFKLIVRFTNGETIQHIVTEPIEPRWITADTRYAVITSVSCQKPNEVADSAIVNLRDVSFIRTERVALDQITGERRLAGLHSTPPTKDDERMPKSVAQIRFI
jgi:hypothetical protein